MKKKSVNPVWPVVLMGIVFAIGGCENGLTDLGGSHSNNNAGNTGDKTSENPLLANIRSVTLDPASNCTNEQVHEHSGVQYSGHYNNDGHGHHGLTADAACAVTDCEQTGLHTHNGTHYAGHSGSDGCGHHGNKPGGHH